MRNYQSLKDAFLEDLCFLLLAGRGFNNKHLKYV